MISYSLLFVNKMIGTNKKIKLLTFLNNIVHIPASPFQFWCLPVCPIPCLLLYYYCLLFWHTTWWSPSIFIICSINIPPLHWCRTFFSRLYHGIICIFRVRLHLLSNLNYYFDNFLELRFPQILKRIFVTYSLIYMKKTFWI